MATASSSYGVPPQSVERPTRYEGEQGDQPSLPWEQIVDETLKEIDFDKCVPGDSASIEDLRVALRANKPIVSQVKALGLPDHPEFGSELFLKQLEMERDAWGDAVDRYHKLLQPSPGTSSYSQQHSFDHLLSGWTDQLVEAIIAKQETMISKARELTPWEFLHKLRVDLSDVSEEDITLMYKASHDPLVKASLLRSGKFQDSTIGHPNYPLFFCRQDPHELAVITINELLLHLTQGNGRIRLARVLRSIAKMIELQVRFNKLRTDERAYRLLVKRQQQVMELGDDELKKLTAQMAVRLESTATEVPPSKIKRPSQEYLVIAEKMLRHSVLPGTVDAMRFPRGVGESEEEFLSRSAVFQDPDVVRKHRTQQNAITLMMKLKKLNRDKFYLRDVTMTTQMSAECVALARDALAAVQGSNALEQKIVYMDGNMHTVLDATDKLLMDAQKMVQEAADDLKPHFKPMLVKPMPWVAPSLEAQVRFPVAGPHGGYLLLSHDLVRCHWDSLQLDRVREAACSGSMQRVLEGVNVLGNTKWAVNKRVTEALETLWSGGGGVGKLVSRFDVTSNDKAPCIKDYPTIEAYWKAKSEYTSQKTSARKANSELAGQRSEIENMRRAAAELRDTDGFYFPHNLDFRGRAYPLCARLNHLKADSSRGLLMFAEKKPLGPNGLMWLKRHLSGLHGVDKCTMAEREEYIDSLLDDIHRTAEDPIGNKAFWINRPAPFQSLAATIEISAAIKSGDPESFLCGLPVHQDGSCNGMQHYAALGRDSAGAGQVNLAPAERPGDPYSLTAKYVAEVVAEVASGNFENIAHINNAFWANEDEGQGLVPPRNSYQEYQMLAQQLDGHVTRKIVKQTVMTSVYGVTFVGARQQIENRLEELEEPVLDEQGNHVIGEFGIPRMKPTIDPDLLWKCSGFLANLTIKAMSKSFPGAKGVMDWLAQLASAYCHSAQGPHDTILSWSTPLGLPVSQHYMEMNYHRVQTVMSQVSLRVPVGERPASKRKQATAFPPNYIHSIDSTHMLMTAKACGDQGMAFAGVHDSFWTHACDVDKLNEILRDEFVSLHSQPLLESLRDHILKMRPKCKTVQRVCAEMPKSGDFELNEVKKSQFFFS